MAHVETISTSIRNRIRNYLGRRRLSRVPQEDIYGRMFAAFYDTALQPRSCIKEAAAAMTAVVNDLVRDDRYYYDLVVLFKTGERLRVRDRRGREFEVFDLVTNSYNDLEWVDENREALLRFVSESPLSSCLSRKIAGLHEVHEDLRRELADHMGYESCVLGTSGYVSQMSTLFALFHQGDVIFSDQHNHSSLVDGCRLSRARVITYPHGDYDALADLLATHRGAHNGAGIVSDGVFSTRGTVADIDRIVALAHRHRCVSIIDDTHGVGVLGRRGRGVVDLFDARPDVLTGGFGKALGSFGGFALSGRALGTVIDIMGRQNVNTSFLSPVMAAQSLINLRYYRSHQASLSQELMGKVRRFNDELGRGGLACYARPEELLHPVFCLFKERELATLACQRRLIEQGFLPSFFPPPVAPSPSLRFSLHRCLPEEALVRLAASLRTMDLFVEAGGRLGQARQRGDYAPHSPHRPGLTGDSRPTG